MGRPLINEPVRVKTWRIEFWSSVEGHGCQQALIRALNADGWRATEVFTVSQEEYRSAKGWRQRLLVRLRTYLAYPLKVGASFIERDRRLIAVVSSNTFFAPWLALTASRDRNPVVHWVLDMYPDVLVAAGVLRGRGLVVSLLRRLMSDTFDRSAANVFLGPRLLRYANEKFSNIPRSAVICIGADEASFPKIAVEDGAPEVVDILYCGNLGHMHDVDTISNAFLRGIPPGVRFAIRGNGPGFEKLRRAMGEMKGSSGVSFGPNMVESEWAFELRRCPVALVTLKAGAEHLVMPSKTYSALLAGQAILAVCAADSDLADLVNTNDLGWTIEPGDEDGFQKVLLRIAEKPEEVALKRRNAAAVGRNAYEQGVLVKQWSSLLSEVVASRESEVII